MTPRPLEAVEGVLLVMVVVLVPLLLQLEMPHQLLVPPPIFVFAPKNKQNGGSFLLLRSTVEFFKVTINTLYTNNILGIKSR